MGEVVCPLIFFFLSFLQDLKFPPCASFFLYHLVSRRCFSLPLHPFLPKTMPFKDCHLDSATLLSVFLIVTAVICQDSLQYFILQGGSLSGNGFDSILVSILTSFFSHLYCFLRACAQSVAYSSAVTWY